MYIGRRIYYDVVSGEVIVDTGERSGSVKETTIPEDIRSYQALYDRRTESYSYLEFEYGSHKEDFENSSGYRVDVNTMELLFTKDNPPPPVENKSLEARILELQQENKLLKAQSKILSDKADFHEAVMYELIMSTYN